MSIISDINVNKYAQLVVTVHVVNKFNMSLVNFPQVRIWLNISSFIQRRNRNELQENQINEINTYREHSS